MTVYVVPCGISLLDGLRVKKGPKNCKPRRLVESASDLGATVLGLPDSGVVDWWVHEAAHLAKEAHLTAWEPQVLCAEANTLAAASGVGRLRELLDQQDRLLVLASDTDSGVAAALYLAQHIAGPDLTDVVYQSSRADQASKPVPPVLRPGTVTVFRLRGLDPVQSDSAFTNAVADTGVALRAAFDVGEKLEVHLSGGFKATLLHTLTMTELLYSLDPGRVRALNLFEGTKTITPIGMRRFDEEYCKEMRDELSSVEYEGRAHLSGQTFEGLAWTKDTYELNAFGKGFLAVLGDRFTPGRPGPGGR